MLKKIIIFLTLSSTILFGKTFNLEALYGFGWAHIPKKTTIQEGSLRAIFFTDNFTHEVLGKASFGANTIINNMYKVKYSGWEAEYRFGTRMDNDMKELGMVTGSAYLGLGYQSIIRNVSIATPLPVPFGNSKITQNYIYMPFGFWGEDSSGVDNLKIRYGVNFKAIFFDDNNDKKEFKYNFLLGGKLYAGAGYSISGIVDIFAQAFFSYNAPIKNIRHYGIEAGIQF